MRHALVAIFVLVAGCSGEASESSGGDDSGVDDFAVEEAPRTLCEVHKIHWDAMSTSAEPEMTLCPSGVTVTAVTREVCPIKAAKFSPDSRSHTFRV